MLQQLISKNDETTHSYKPRSPWKKLDQGHLFKQNTLPICPPCSTREKLIDSGTRKLLTYVNVSTWTGGGSRTSTSQPISTPNIRPAFPRGAAGVWASGQVWVWLWQTSSNQTPCGWMDVSYIKIRPSTSTYWMAKKRSEWWNISHSLLTETTYHGGRWQSPQSKQCQQNIIKMVTRQTEL